MGVEFSHGDARFAHRQFAAFREALADMAGLRLGDYQGFGGSAAWSTVADPIAPLLGRNDAGGVLSPEEARGSAVRLAELAADPRNLERFGGDPWEELLRGLEEAATLGEPFEILG